MNKYLKMFLKNKNLKVGKDGNLYTKSGKRYEGGKSSPRDEDRRYDSVTPIRYRVTTRATTRSATS